MFFALTEDGGYVSGFVLLKKIVKNRELFIRNRKWILQKENPYGATVLKYKK